MPPPIWHWPTEDIHTYTPQSILPLWSWRNPMQQPMPQRHPENVRCSMSFFPDTFSTELHSLFGPLWTPNPSTHCRTPRGHRHQVLPGTPAATLGSRPPNSGNYATHPM